MDLVIYHNNCADGFCAAYVARQRYPEATFMPLDHGLEPPYAAVEGKDVLVLDFSWPSRSTCETLARYAKSFRILDHHKTAQGTLAGLPFATFDMKRSGAGLAWDYLFGKDAHEKIGEIFVPPSPRPWFVNYAEDYDLWKFELPESRAVNAYIQSFPFEFTVWDRNIAGDFVDRAAAHGATCLRQAAKLIAEGVRQAQFGKLFFLDEKGYVHEYGVAVVSALYTNCGEIGEALAERPDVDVAMIWFERYDGQMRFAVRSKHTGNVDVSQIAKAKLGGGHKTAAGFTLSISEGRTLIDSILGRTVDKEDRVFQFVPNKNVPA
jgi:uncharacterized protein